MERNYSIGKPQQDRCVNIGNVCPLTAKPKFYARQITPIPLNNSQDYTVLLLYIPKTKLFVFYRRRWIILGLF